MPRLTPFDLVFGPLGEEGLPSVVQAVAAAELDVRDRDALLLQRDVAAFLRELRPDDGLGEGTDEFVAFVHHALAWAAGGHAVHEVAPAALAVLLAPQAGTAEPASAPIAVAAQRTVAAHHDASTPDLTAGSPAADAPTGPLAARYIALPERRVWGAPVPGAPHEPLDGLHLLATADGRLRVLACFGVHAQRQGLTVVEAVGPRAAMLARADGTPLFAPVMPGGATAGLHEVIGDAELLELGWRAADLPTTES